jgi:tRNA(fMet)-specific endonuclease VapC
MHGALKYQLAEKRRQTLEALLKPYASLPYDDAATTKYAEIRHFLELRGEVIGPFDLQIAAIALAHDLTLVTHNTGEFSRVPGLRLEDWSL